MNGSSCFFCFPTLFLLFFMRSERDCPDAVFSLPLVPLKTATFANLPRAILLTAFFFITFMLFMVVFITDFFIGRAIVNQDETGRDQRQSARSLQEDLNQFSYIK